MILKSVIFLASRIFPAISMAITSTSLFHPISGVDKFRQLAYKWRNYFSCISFMTVRSTSPIDILWWILNVFKQKKHFSNIAMGVLWLQSSMSCHHAAGGVVSEANSGIPIRGLVVPDLLIYTSEDLSVSIYIYIYVYVDSIHTYTKTHPPSPLHHSYTSSSLLAFLCSV